MKNLTLENIAKSCKGTYFGPQEALQKEVKGIAIDSRKMEKDWLLWQQRGSG